MHLLPLAAHDARRSTARAAQSALPHAPRQAPTEVPASPRPGPLRRGTAGMLRRAADRLAPAYHAPDAGQGRAPR